MRRGRSIAALVCAVTVLAATVTVARAEDVVKYDIDECVRIALERSIPAANARRDEQIAATKVMQTRSQALPQFNLGANYTRLDELQSFDFGGETVEIGELDNYKAGFDASQLLYSGGRVRAALRAAHCAKDYAEAVRSEYDQQLTRTVKQGFYAILLAEATVKVREESLAQLKLLLDQTQSRYDNGAASEFDLITARVRHQNEKPRLIRAQNNYAVAKEDFRRLLNLEDEPFDLDGELIFVPVDVAVEDLYPIAQTNRWVLRQFTTEVRLREQDLAASRGEYLPDLRAVFQYNGANGQSFSMGESDWEWHWNAGAVLSWNLWDGGLRRGVVREKSLELDKSSGRLEDMRNNVRLEVTSAYLTMRDARQTVESGRGNVELAEKGLEIAKVRHDTGLVTYLEFTESNLALSEARLTWYLALYAHLNAVTRLSYACGLTEQELKAQEREP